MRHEVLLVFLMRFEEAAPMLQGITHYQRTHGQWLAFLDDEARAESEPRWVRAKRWHGVISRHTTPGLVQVCRRLRIPLVDLNDVAPFPGVPKVRPDNVALGHLGAEHFLERGHRHFAFAGFGNEPWSCERRDGFVDALRLAGHLCQVFDVNYPGVVTPRWDQDQAAALAAWLRRLPKPVGIMACVDMRAFQVLQAAQIAGLLVPEEVAVLGVNNDAIRCDLSYPPLSSVAPDPFQSGYQAATLLDQLMRGRRPKPVDLRIEPLGVVSRRSTDVLAIHDRILATALSFIREQACRGVTVEAVTRHAAASRSQLEKKFRRHFGRSPQAEIRRVQMEKVRQLLRETDFPLKRIAEFAGFEHAEYLSVVFKRLSGETPGAFRRKAQARGISDFKFQI